MANVDEWRGRTGQEWARRGRALDLLLGPAAEAGLTALDAQPGMHVLDLGCGSGASTKVLVDRVGSSGNVTGIDVSTHLMRQAREALGTTPNITLTEADAETHPFAEASFDALYSRFGSMFFTNPRAAFANLKRAMKPGAPVVFVAWREPARNHWASVPMTFAADAPHAPGPSSGPGPFAWASPEVFRPILSEAGFTGIREHEHAYSAEISEGDDPDPVARAVRFMMRIGPLAARLRGAPDAAKEEAEVFLSERLRRHVHDGAVRLRASSWIIRAEA